MKSNAFYNVVGTVFLWFYNVKLYFIAFFGNKYAFDERNYPAMGKSYYQSLKLVKNDNVNFMDIPLLSILTINLCLTCRHSHRSQDGKLGGYNDCMSYLLL